MVIVGLYLVLWGKAEDKKDQSIGTSGVEQTEEDVAVTVREPLINGRP